MAKTKTLMDADGHSEIPVYGSGAVWVQNVNFPNNYTFIAVEPVLATGRLTCHKCKHNQAWQCNSKVFHYCGIRKSKRTSNGQLKIKCKDVACSLFEPFNKEK